MYAIWTGGDNFVTERLRVQLSFSVLVMSFIAIQANSNKVNQSVNSKIINSPGFWLIVSVMSFLRL